MSTATIPDLIPLADAVAEFPEAVRPNVSTLRRWCASGRLPARRIGGRWATTRAAVAEFCGAGPANHQEPDAR